jgi:hypothetical protein
MSKRYYDTLLDCLAEYMIQHVMDSSTKHNNQMERRLGGKALLPSSRRGFVVVDNNIAVA